MNQVVTCQAIQGVTQAIASKSDVHRALICAALADRESYVAFDADSQDIAATMQCLQSLGAAMERDAHGVRIRPLQISDAPVTLDCGESGSTLRFLLPVAAALSADCTLTGRGRLMERPLEPLLTQLRAHGVTVEQDPSGVHLHGKLQGGVFTLPGNVSSQFVTGLLLALPLAGGGTVEVLPPVESRNYIDMTVDTMRRYGVRITAEDTTYRIPADAAFTLQTDTCIADGDWSNGAFFLSAAAIAGEVTVNGLRQSSLQGDKRITSLLASFGADVRQTADSVTVRARPLHGITIDAAQIPDLVPILAVAASFAKGETVIANAGRLRIKESDRLAAIETVLTAVGADVTALEDGLVIHGNPDARYHGCADSCNDHRIAMALAVASMRGGEITITNAQAVRKSYPRFFEDFTALGGVCHVM